MHFTQREKLSRAEQAIEKGDYPGAEAILISLWEEYPFDYEIFRLLNECYKVREDWGASEALILAFGKTLSGEDFKNEALLQLYLDQGDAKKALGTAREIIAQNPDYYESIASIAYSFKSKDLEKVFFDFLSDLSVPGFNRYIALAMSRAYLSNDYQAAIDHIKAGLEKHPGDALLLSSLQAYESSLKQQKIVEARRILGREMKGDAVAACKTVWQLAPGSVTAKEYYLSALACRKFPPFSWYFHANNFVGTSPYSFRAIVVVIFFVVCALYYKGGKPVDATDHLTSVVWLFAGLSIPRYTLFPLLVQLLAFRYVPGYHLLQRPFEFLKGAILLGVWLLALQNDMYPDAKGFHYFLTGCFATHVFLFDYADKLESQIQQKLLRAYALLALSLAVLSYAGLIPEVFLFFVFAAWLPPVFAGQVWSFFQKYREANTANNPDSSAAEVYEVDQSSVRKAPKTTLHLQLTFGALSAAGFIGLVAAKHVPEAYENALLFASFALLLYGAPIAMFCSGEPEHTRDMGWLWNHSVAFRVVIGVAGVGMVAEALSVAPYGDIPLRTDWRWIPGILGLFACWFGLIFYLSKQLKKMDE